MANIGQINTLYLLTIIYLVLTMIELRYSLSVLNTESSNKPNSKLLTNPGVSISNPLTT